MSRYMWKPAVFALIAAVTLQLASTDAPAQTPRIKLATIAPRGSAYHQVLLEMGEAWRRAEAPGATFTIFTDGSQGGEADMVRRMRIGQLNAALMSVIGLTEIDAGAGALQKMPLMFRSWEEVDAVGQRLHPLLEKRFLDKGFVVLFWAEGGWVRLFSKERALRPGDYKRLKMFAWAGDPEQIGLMKALGYQPVMLETADILPGLQTGLINAVPVTALWALAGKSAAQNRGVASFFAYLARPQVQAEWHQRTGDLPLTTAAYELTRKQGFYHSHPGQEIAVRQLLPQPTGDSGGIRLGGLRHIRGISGEELESVWNGKKAPLDALNAGVCRGNLLLEGGR